MSNLPPMSGRTFRAEFMRPIKPEPEYRDLSTDRTPIRYDDDPYERCDFAEGDDADD